MALRPRRRFADLGQIVWEVYSSIPRWVFWSRFVLNVLRYLRLRLGRDRDGLSKVKVWTIPTALFPVSLMFAPTILPLPTISTTRLNREQLQLSIQPLWRD